MGRGRGRLIWRPILLWRRREWFLARRFCTMEKYSSPRATSTRGTKRRRPWCVSENNEEIAHENSMATGGRAGDRDKRAGGRCAFGNRRRCGQEIDHHPGQSRAAKAGQAGSDLSGRGDCLLAGEQERPESARDGGGVRRQAQRGA